MAFITEIAIDQLRQSVVSFFRNPEIWFRLNPEWELLKITKIQGSEPCIEFIIEVLYDQSELQVTYQVKFEEWPGGEGLTLLLNGDSPRQIQLKFEGKGDIVNSLVHKELGEIDLEPHQQTEIVLWLKSTADYIEISSRRSWHWRVVRYLLDKVWLRLNPTGRRVVFLIIAFELAGLVLLLGLLMAQRWL
jgi:hypothetical protein